MEGWAPASDSPALFIDTTEVGSGRGRVISPFKVDAAEYSHLPFASKSAKESNPGISMSTAAVLSARFPWLTPAGTFQLETRDVGSAALSPARQTIELVDGGYLDNSGVVMALNILREIKEAVAQMSPSPKVQVNLIILPSADFASPRLWPGDYLTPVEALLSTRASRGAVAIRQAESALDNVTSKDSSDQRLKSSLAKAVLQGYGYPLPLGWRLSPITRLLILGQNGSSTVCPQRDESPNCLRAKVYQQLNR